MNTEDKQELERDAQDLSYLYIRLSGLSEMLKTNADDDVLATQIAERIMSLVEGMVSAVRDEIEAQGHVKATAGDVSAIIERYGRAA